MDTALKDLIWNIAKSHITKAITFLAGVLVTKGVIEENQSTPLVSGFVEIAMGALTFLVSSLITIYLRYRDQIKLAIAARLPAGVSLEKVNQEAAKNTTPLKALSVLLAVGVLANTGCALFKANATEPERPVAATGIAISDGLTKARIATTDLYNAKAFPFDGETATAKYTKVLGYFREAQVAGNELADALALYHAQPNETNAQKVAAVFATLNTKWPQITEELGGSSLPGRLVSIVAEVNKLMDTVRGAFAKPSARLSQEVFTWV